MIRYPLALALLVLAAAPAMACTDIIVGKLASTDGSVITSHTGSSPECRVRVVPGREFPSSPTCLTAASMSRRKRRSRMPCG